MRLGLKTAQQVHEENLRDPEYRALWERTTLARVATALVRYRADHDLSQRALARRLGWQQPQVARLELGEHTPTIETLVHLSRRLGMHFAVSIGGVRLERLPGDVVEEVEGSQVTAMAGTSGSPTADDEEDRMVEDGLGSLRAMPP
jgi:transcriptional regulator with XRE-family HTH domain